MTSIFLAGPVAALGASLDEGCGTVEARSARGLFIPPPTSGMVISTVE
jgi:hypothetical protein